MTHINAMLRSNLSMLREVFMSTMRTTCMIMFILMAAFTLQFAFAYLRISHALADLVVSLELTQMQLVGILIVFYLLLGTFMESPDNKKEYLLRQGYRAHTHSLTHSYPHSMCYGPLHCCKVEKRSMHYVTCKYRDCCSGIACTPLAPLFLYIPPFSC